MTADPQLARRVATLERLLSDPNERIASTIHAELVKLGAGILPLLRPVDDTDALLATRLQAVRDDICIAQIQAELERRLEGGRETLDLESGAFLIARVAYPDLDIPHYARMLDALADGVRSRVDAHMPPETASHELSRYLFGEQGFHGNREEYYDPDNSFLNRVLERRTGIPITLSVVYLLVAKRLGLPMAGTGMPGHFVVKVEVDDDEPPLFIDCFNGGAALQTRDCEQFLANAGIPFNPDYLSPTPNDLILARMLRNLVGVYTKRGQTGQATRLQSLIPLLDSTP